MIVSHNWLKDYVPLEMRLDVLTERLTLTGLNLEGIDKQVSDIAIDLEVTSNRPDCLGHIGVAREISVLWEKSLKIPAAEPKTVSTSVDSLTSVTVQCPELCPRYTARVIRGVKIGPSPEWLVERLQALGIGVVNNVVDVTNYVMMECGQPLHAFDFAKLAGQKIMVREARQREKFTAINHQEYELSPGTCVIADAERAVALGGVMGGEETEVSEATTDLLIEAADFNPLSVRNTARGLNLHSPSSYRFERGVDPQGVDWASRRCCELILELAGGELAEGVIDVGEPYQKPEPIKLRFDQLPRVLGIDVPDETVQKILNDLGCEETHHCEKCVKVIPPSWRADLTREVDLIEEVARIYGYDQIPEDAGVKMVASTRSREDRVLDQVRDLLVAAGFDEAMTISAVGREWVEIFRPWTSRDALSVSTPVLRGADCLRQTLLPSLLAARRTNETLSNPRVELFEIADVYLPLSTGLPDERRMLGLTSGGGFFELKGVVESLVARLAPTTPLEVEPFADKFFTEGRGCQLKLEGQVWGYLGEVSQLGLDHFDLRSPSTVAEVDLGLLIDSAVLVRRTEKLSPYPPVSRDLNVVVDLKVSWAEIERVVRQHGSEHLESVTFQDDSYRDPKQIGQGKKSVLFTFELRSAEGTLTNEEADAVRDQIVAALDKQLGGKLRG